MAKASAQEAWDRVYRPTEEGRSGSLKGPDCLQGRPRLSWELLKSCPEIRLSHHEPWWAGPVGHSGFPFHRSVSPAGGRSWPPVLPPLAAVVLGPGRACVERGDAGASPGILRGRSRADGGGVRLSRGSGLGQLQIPRARGRSLVGTEPTGVGWAGPPDPAGLSNKAAFQKAAFRN